MKKHRNVKGLFSYLYNRTVIVGISILMQAAVLVLMLWRFSQYFPAFYVFRVIGDNGKCDKDAIENIDGVKGVFFASGQLQIIFGTGTVNKVYDEFIRIAGITAASKEEAKQAATAKQNIFQRLLKTLGDVFVPIIPAIVASGLLMGLLEGLSKVYPAMADSGTYTIIHLFSSAAFTFLPILIAVSAARVFGGNLFLGAVIGMIMVHPDLMNAWSVATADSVPQASAWFGLYHIDLVGYQGHVI